MKTTVILPAVSACLLFWLQPAYSHGDVDEQVGTRVAAAVSVTWRDEGMLLQDGRWQIPGVLMGGEAYPVTADTQVDEARISVAHRTAQQVFGYLQVSSHDGVSDAEVHHAYAGLDFETGPLRTRLVAGRMAAAMTPANGEHTSDRLFSETPLPLSAFLGGQLNDDGVRLALKGGGFELGLENWRGDAFPATPDAGDSGDLYLHYRDNWGDLMLNGGVWWLQADADDRMDTRYAAGGHSHGTVTTAAPEYWFDGRTTMNGVFLRLNQSTSENWHWTLEAQYMQADIEGIIWDSARLAQWQADDNGGWLQASVGYQQHLFGLRWERLVLDNQITGAAAMDMANLAGLYNPDHDPERTSVLYRYQLRPELALRIEVIDDGIQVTSIDRLALGLVWRSDLYP